MVFAAAARVTVAAAARVAAARHFGSMVAGRFGGVVAFAAMTASEVGSAGGFTAGIAITGSGLLEATRCGG